MINSVSLTGRLTKDVDLKYTSNGTAVGTFTVAVNRNFKNAQGEYESDFILCQIWRKAAENFANFTRKGSLVGIQGRIQTRNYENQQGQRVFVTEVVVENFTLLESREVTEQRPREGAQNNQNRGNYNNQNQGGWTPQNNDPFLNNGQPIDIDESDLPF